MGTLRVKSNGQWIDVITGTAARAGFARRGSTAPAIPQSTWTALPLDVLMSTGNWQWTYATNLITCPVAGVYALHASIASLNTVFPTGTMLTIIHNVGGTSYARARAVANKTHLYETLEASCEWPLAVGDRVGINMIQEGVASFTGLRQANDLQAVDPPTPFLSCWRISY